MSTLLLLLSLADDLGCISKSVPSFYGEPAALAYYGFPLWQAPQQRAAARQHEPKSLIGKDGLQVSMDVAQFKPSELSVKVMDNSIVVEGKHEEREDDHGYLSRHFVRRYALPMGYEADKVVSTLSSDGVLTITAPKPQHDEKKCNERIVQVQQTGAAHLNMKENAVDRQGGGVGKAKEAEHPKNEQEYFQMMPLREKGGYQIGSNAGGEPYQQKLRTVEEDEHIYKRRGVCHQIIVTCAILLMSTACGMPIGYSSVLLPQLMNTPNTVAEGIVIDIEMSSWIASVHSLATPVGSLISGPIADYMGRRTTLLVSVIPMFLGWCIMALSNLYPMLLVGRMLCGFATGIMGGLAQVYIAEATEPNIRSLLIGAPLVCYSLGILIVYALGSVLHWRVTAWCGTILPGFAGVAIFCIPESPVWLLRKGKTASAQKAMTFLRGNEIIAQKELNEMAERLQRENTTAKANENICQLLSQRVTIKPLFIVMVFVVFQMFSGTFIVVFHAIDVISSFGVNVDSKSAAIWTAAVRMSCCMILCVVLLFVKRRLILMISSIGSGLGCLVLSSFMYAELYRSDSTESVTIVAFCLLTYIAFNTAVMVMPGIMVGELFPAKIRGRTAGGVFAAMNFMLFCLLKAYPYIKAAIGIRGVFVIFALSSFLCSLFMFMFQPETKGRSLDQIEDYFKENNWLWFRRTKQHRRQGRTPNAE